MRTRRDTAQDILLCLVILVFGLVAGYRVAVMNGVSDQVMVPQCAEDEWISPDTLRCVHVDVIVNESLTERGTIEVPR